VRRVETDLVNLPGLGSALLTTAVPGA
jgi:hypothetical protein